ncbi:MAG TPA: hypothetical protein VGV93_01030 [Acidimicrobiales bacterium]|nr:hypothetical protein [Acidimicrobiales bacterium]
MTDRAPGGSGPKRNLFLAPLGVADEPLHPAPEEPSPEPAGATTVEPARARARGGTLLAGVVALVAAVILFGDRDESGNGERKAIATTTTARRPATTTTTPLGEQPATGPLLPEPTGAALAVVTNSQVLVVDLDTGGVRSVAVAGRESYHGAWAVGEAVVVQGPAGVSAVPVASNEGPVVLTEGRAADWPLRSDRPGHVWLITHVPDGVEGREVSVEGHESGRRFVLPATHAGSSMVAVDGGLVMEAYGSLIFYNPDTGEARPIGHGLLLAGSGDTLARAACEALRCGLQLTGLRTGAGVDVLPPAGSLFFPFPPAAFSPDGRWLVVPVGAMNETTDRVAVIDVGNGEVVAVHPWAGGHGTPFTFSPDSRWLFLLNGRDVTAHRLGTDETLTLERLHPGGAIALAAVALGE